MRGMVWSVAASLLCACALSAGNRPAVAEVASTEGRPPLETVSAFLAHYNAHDVEALLALADEQIVWLSIAGEQAEVLARGRAALGDALRRYFGDYPQARSEIDATLTTGAYVATRERAYWLDGDAERTQAALAIYEICGERVCRVWYYPAVYD